MFEFKEIKSEAEYKPIELKLDVPFTQAWVFSEWQEMMGRKVRRFEISREGENTGFFQIIKYPLLLSKSILYIPHGPVLKIANSSSDEFLKEFRKKLFEIGKEEDAIFVRFDFYFRNSDYGSVENFKRYFKKVPSYAYYSPYFQPKFEWILNLEKSEEELLNNIHPKTRYGIRLAESRSVKVEVIKTNFQKHFPDFYDLMKKTAARNKFSLHPEIYYRNIFSNCEENKNAFLMIATYDSKTLAINLVLLYGETAYFIFGASSDEFKNLMAPHLLHWRAAIEIKKLGFKIYNFGAVGEEYEGVSRFKKRFGGELLEHSDSYDLVLEPIWYHLYNLRKWVSNLPPAGDHPKGEK